MNKSLQEWQKKETFPEGNSLAWSNLNLGHTDDAFRLVEKMKTFAPNYNENLELEFILLLISGQREAAAAVGKRLAEILNKKTLNLGPYLDLFGEVAQREAVLAKRKFNPLDEIEKIAIENFLSAGIFNRARGGRTTHRDRSWELRRAEPARSRDH